MNLLGILFDQMGFAYAAGDLEAFIDFQELYILERHRIDCMILAGPIVAAS